MNTGLLCDTQIQELAVNNGMIIPFVDQLVSRVDSADTATRIISYGLSSYGYDARLADTLRIFTNVNSTLIDPKAMDNAAFVTQENRGEYIIPPNSFALGHTVERFRVPDDVLVLCIGKSTYARTGLIVNVTPLEPGWEGQVTLEFSNTTPLPLKIYANEGVCQFLFLRGQPCRTPYSARNGKYQGQSGVTLPKV